METESAYADIPADPVSGKSIRNNAKVERLLGLIEEHRGNVSAIARAEAVSRSVCKQYIDKVPELCSALQDWRNGIVDRAEDNIFKAVESGDLGSSKMVVSMLGKDRGWVTREEQTGKDGTPLIPPSITFAPYEDESEEPTPVEAEEERGAANE